LRHSHGYIRFLRIARLLVRILFVGLGAGLFAVTIKCFYEPNHMLSGGITGTALLIRTLTGFPVGLGMALLNVPVFLLGFRDIGRRFALLSGFGVLFFWFFADFLPLRPFTHDPMLGAIFGGVIAGTGTSIALKAGGSLGGFDIVGVFINRRFSTGVGEVLLALNGLLVLAAGLTASPEAAMYTLVGIFAASRVLDAMQTPRTRKAFAIVTSRPEEMRERISGAMNRGVTIWSAHGRDEAVDRAVLLCVVTRAELRELAEVVREVDRTSFTVVLEASQVFGHFRRRGTMESLKQIHDQSGRHAPSERRIL